MLISRLLLDLQSASKASVTISSSSGSGMESIVFQRVWGSLGVSLSPGQLITRESNGEANGIEGEMEVIAMQSTGRAT